MEKMKYNANNMYDYFCLKCGWTKNALAGMLGNMQSESTLNPACWQNWRANIASPTQTSWPSYTTADDYYSKYMYSGEGFGLVQWTQQRKFFEWYFNEFPAITLSTYRNYQALLDYDKELVDGKWRYVTIQQNPKYKYEFSYELYRIWFEVENDLQWTSSIYNQTFKEFTKSTESAYDLGVKFLHAYEKPAEYHDEIRGNQAAQWYEFLGGTNPVLFAPWMVVQKPYWLNGRKSLL